MQKIVGKYSFNMNHLIGKGAYGTVYQGISNDGMPVAVKVIDRRMINQTNNQQLLNEIRSMKQLNHKNIVKFLDFYETQNNFYSQFKNLLYYQIQIVFNNIYILYQNFVMVEIQEIQSKEVNQTQNLLSISLNKSQMVIINSIQTLQSIETQSQLIYFCIREYLNQQILDLQRKLILKMIQ